MGEVGGEALVYGERESNVCLGTHFFTQRKSNQSDMNVILLASIHLERTGSLGSSSVRRRSLSISSRLGHQNDNNDAEAERVSEAA